MSAPNVALNEQESSFDLVSASRNAVVTSSSVPPYTREILPSTREQNGDIFEVLKRLAEKHRTRVRPLHLHGLLDGVECLPWNADCMVQSAFGNSQE
jgi:hypothetical protein